MAQQQIFGDIPPELIGDQRVLERQQRIAEAMMQQGMAPQEAGRMVGRFFVPNSPLQGLAGLANTYVGTQMGKEVDKGYGDLATRKRQMVVDELAKIQGQMTGSAPRPQVMGADDMAMIADQGGQSAPTTQDVKPNMDAAMMAGMGGMSPQARAIGQAIFAQKMKANDPFTLAPGASRVEGGQITMTAPNRVAPEKTFKVGDTRNMRSGREIITQEYQPDRTWKVIAKGEVDKPGSTVVHNPAPVTAVTIQDPDNPNGTIVLDGRTGKVFGKGPKLTDSGKLENKRQFNMQGIGKTIQEADDLLTGKSGKDLPTGSGFGSALDYAAGFVGANPAGAKEAQTLKAIGGALVSKMPRMEGPQSDKDVAMYREMSGVVGDSTIPRERRIAALEKVKEIWAKYENLNPAEFADRRGGNEPPPGAVRPR